MDCFEYKGKSYPFKCVFFRSEGMGLIVSCEDLARALLPNGSEYDSEEARLIDEQVFFFVPNDVLNKEEEAIEKYVGEAI